MNEKTDIAVPDKGDEVPNCANCFFSEKLDLEHPLMTPAAAGPSLICRRYPPAVMEMVTPQGQQAVGSASSPVRPQDWCGEHEPTHAPLIEH